MPKGHRVNVTVDVNELVRLYVDEAKSLLWCSRHFGIARSALRRLLGTRGLVPRGRHESAVIRMSLEGADGRRALVAKAHDASRGKRRSHKTLVQIATVKASIGRRSRLESYFHFALQKFGLFAVSQFQVDIYNIDLALPDVKVAVEIDPGNWHSSPKKMAIDARKDVALVAAGWAVVRLQGADIRLSNPALTTGDLAWRLIRDRVIPVVAMRQPEPLP